MGTGRSYLPEKRQCLFSKTIPNEVYVKQLLSLLIFALIGSLVHLLASLVHPVTSQGPGLITFPGNSMTHLKIGLLFFGWAVILFSWFYIITLLFAYTHQEEGNTPGPKETKGQITGHSTKWIMLFLQVHWWEGNLFIKHGNQMGK